MVKTWAKRLYMAFIFLFFGDQPVGNLVLARFTPLRLRGLGFGFSFFFAFGMGQGGLTNFYLVIGAPPP